MKNYLFYILVFILSIESFSQTKLYVDENLKYIDSIVFFNKCKTSKVLNCKKYYYSKDTTFFIINSKYKIGKLSIINLKKIEKTLNLNDKQYKNVIIKSYDSLAIIANILNSSTYRIVKSIKNEIKGNITLEIKRNRYKNTSFTISKNFIKTFNNKIKNRRNCLKKINKNDILVFYKVEDKLLSLFPKIKEYHFDKNTFLKDRYNLLFKPNGEYFKFLNLIPKNKLDILLKHDKFEQYKIDLDNAKKNKNSIFFNHMGYIYGNYICF